MTDHKRAVFPEGGAKPLAPYSPGIVSGGFLFVAGQVGIDPATGQVAGDTIEAQTRQAMKNIAAVLEAAGCGFKDVVRVNAYVTKVENFQGFNDVYRQFFSEPYPARSTIICGLARLDLLVEVDAIAKIPDA